MAKKFIGDGLSESKDLVNFKEQFSKEEGQQLSQLRCRLYSDFQTQPVRKCNFFDAYNQMDKLFAHILRTENHHLNIYQNYVKSELKTCVVSVRDYRSYVANRNFQNFVEKVEEIKCFRSAGLEQWLSLKSSELDMMDSMVKKARNRITILSDRNQLKQTRNTLSPYLFRHWMK